MTRLPAHHRVSANFRVARLLKGWTQAEAAERLEPFLGRRLSRPGYSAAERTTGFRPKKWDVDELEAIAACFGQPVTWFLDDPREVQVHVRIVRSAEVVDTQQTGSDPEA